MEKPIQVEHANHALNVLHNATEPQNVGKLLRKDFVAVESALNILSRFIAQNTPAAQRDTEVQPIVMPPHEEH